MKRVSALCLTLLLGASLVHAQQGQTPSPQEILTRMVSIYASCDSYADRGEVKTVFFEGGGARTTYRPFSTAFVRPSRFRFEFEERTADNRSRQYIVWREGYAVRSWWTVQPKPRAYETLSLAIAGATGVSGGSAMTVPSMLMGDLGDRHVIQTLTQLVLRGEEKVGGRMAYRVEGRDWRNNLLTLWIDKESFLLLKIHEKIKLKDVEEEKTTTYQPRVNIQIAPDQLAFKH